MQTAPLDLRRYFYQRGLGSLFSDISKLPLVLVTIFSFSVSDTFDTIGTFIGTGRRTGIFSDEDERAMETTPGFKSKMDKRCLRRHGHINRCDFRHLQYDDLCRKRCGNQAPADAPV